MITTDAIVTGLNSVIARMWQDLGFPKEGGASVAREIGVRTAVLYPLAYEYFHNLTVGLQRCFLSDWTPTPTFA